MYYLPDKIKRKKAVIIIWQLSEVLCTYNKIVKFIKSATKFKNNLIPTEISRFLYNDDNS